MTSGLMSVSPIEIESLRNRVRVDGFAGKEFLVTGASGMVASYFVSALQGVCEALSYSPPNFTLLVRDLSSKNLHQFQNLSNIRLIQADLEQWDVDREFDFLLHAASPASPTKYKNPAEILNANVGFFENLSKTAFPKHSLFISSGEVYGSRSPVPVTEGYKGSIDISDNRSAYPLAKLEGERLLLKLAMENEADAKIVRLFHTFGPGMKPDDGRSFADFLWVAARGKDIVLHSTGSDIRTFLYLEDAFAGMLQVLNEGSNFETYNLGSRSPLSVLEFAKLVGDTAGVNVVSKSVENLPPVGYVPSPNAIIVPSINKIAEIGWSERIGVIESIRRTLIWARGQEK